MSEIDGYARAVLLSSNATKLLRQISSASSLGVPKICDSCITGLEAFVRGTESRQREIEQRLGLSIRVDDPELLKFTDTEYSGKICVVFNETPEVVGAKLGIMDFRTGFTVGSLDKVKNYLPQDYDARIIYEVVRDSGKTLIFVPDMRLAKAFVAMYIGRSSSQPKSLVESPNL